MSDLATLREVSEILSASINQFGTKGVERVILGFSSGLKRRIAELEKSKAATVITDPAPYQPPPQYTQ